MKFTGLMGVDDRGTLITPNGNNLFRIPLCVALIVQKIQHWYAVKTWKD